MSPRQAASRKMEASDTEEVVAVHLESFRNFFLSFLGPAFLRVLYSFFMEDPSSIAIVTTAADGRIVGFVAGTVEPGGFYTRAIRLRWSAFALAAIPALIKKPSILPRLARALRKPGEARELPADCELMSIAVLPSCAGQGIGRLLEDKFTEEAKKRGCRAVELTTDAEGNDAVNAFYLSRGYVLHGKFLTSEGRPMNRYVKRIETRTAT